MEFEKIKKLDSNQLNEYKNNKNIRRRKILSGGYEKIVFASVFI